MPPTDIATPVGPEAPPHVEPEVEDLANAPERDPEKVETAAILTSYLREARQNRAGGPNPRDAKWSELLDLYWNRVDFGEKQEWQAKETTPEVPAFVDRFAAALKEAYGVVSEAMYTVVDPGDPNSDLTEPVKRMTDAWLSTAGRNATGHPMGFEAVFEEQMKLGALMATSAVVTWKDDAGAGRVAVDSEDPRKVWLDHTGRGMYRIRAIDMDKHRLKALAKMRDNRGNPLYNLDELNAQADKFLDELKQEAEELKGHGSEDTSTRREVVLHEFYGDIVKPDGTAIAENSMAVMAGEEFLIRGPEPNPFWHGRDWITYAPLVTAPLSPYGRAFGEDFASVARVFNKITNLILDAVAFSSIKTFASIPEMLVDSSQLEGGITPGKNFKLHFGLGSAEEFLSAIDLGQVSGDTVQVWQLLKNELTEAARTNEVGLGQFAPNSRTSATEISETQQSSSALVRSVAQTVEHRFFEPTVDLVWKTGLQHVKRDDRLIAAAAGPEMFQALLGVRKELIKRPLTFQARGLSTLIHKSNKLRSLIQLLQIIASNDVLLQQFLQVVDMAKLVDLLFDLASLDISQIRLTEREQQTQEITQALSAQAGAEAPSGGSGGAPPKPAQDLASQLGISRG